MNTDPLIRAQDLTINYPIHDTPAITDLNLQIGPGEFIVIAGPSGSGKSTFCRTLIGLIPNLTKGDITGGSLEVCGLDTRNIQVHTLTQQVGMVFQDPDMNIFSLNVLDELAFGPENLGLEPSEIIRRIEEVSDWVGIQELWPRRTERLSGGQKQRVAIAGVLAMQPKVLVLDEPTTDLDPVGKKQVINTLMTLKNRQGLTIIVIEHDLTNLIRVADRLVILGTNGKLLYDDAPSHVLDHGFEAIRRHGIRIPTFVAVGRVLRRKRPGHPQEPIPLDQESASRLLLANKAQIREMIAEIEIPNPPPVNTKSPLVLDIKGLHFHYHKERHVIKGINLEIRRSEVTAIVGPNGSGKSTLLKLIVGLNKPAKGTIKVFDRTLEQIPPKRLADHVSFVFQDPNHQLFENTVWEEVAFGLRIRGEDEEAIQARVSELLDKVKLFSLKDRHPATLSRGEKRRLAVATALSYPVDILLLDEPTTGQDFHTLEGLFEILGRLRREDGTTIIFVTHDLWTVWKYASYVVGMYDGQILAHGPTQEILHPGNQELLARLECELPLEATIRQMLADKPSDVHVGQSL